MVTASPHNKSIEEIAGSLNLLDTETLQREVGATLGDSLKNQLGIHSSSFGPGVGVPVIRGQSGKRVEVLQNSTSIADVSDTSADHAVATETILADRIEIIRGPATLRYGAGAIGGVVNVIDNRIHTESFEGASGTVETRYNANNSEKVIVGRFDAGSGGWNLHLDAVARDSDDVEIPGAADLEADDPDETTFGYIENSSAESDAFSVGISWVGDSSVAGFSISQNESNYGVPSGAHGHHEEGHEEEEEEHEEEEHHDEEVLVRLDMEQTQYQGKLTFNDLAGTWNTLDIDLNYTEYAHNELEIEEGVAEIGTLFEVNSTEFRGEVTHEEVNGWIGAIGLQTSIRDFVAEGEEAFVAPSKTKRTGLYIIEETALGIGNLELGLRVDQQRLTSQVESDLEHDSVSYSASYLMPLADNQRIGLLFSKSERAPVAEELLAFGEHVAEGNFVIGDASLGKENAFNAELTWAYEAVDSSGLSARASIYYSDFADYIYRLDTELRFSHDLEHDLEDGGVALGLNVCSSDLADFENDMEEYEESVECFLYTQEDATFSGVEAEIQFALNTNHSARIWGDYVSAEFSDTGDVPRMPPARIGASWDFTKASWSTQLSITHAMDQDKPGEGQEETEGYTRIDAYAGWNADPFTLFIKATNLTDEDIRNSTSLLREIAPEPGRAITLGARYNF